MCTGDGCLNTSLITIPVGPVGPQGVAGATGPQGIQGIQGIQGVAGADGIKTGYTDHWLYNNTTTPSGAGQVRFNSLFPNLVTKIYISTTNYESISVATFLDSFLNQDDSGSTIVYSRFGDLKIFSNADINDYITFKILNVTVNVGYAELDVIKLTSSSAISIPFITTDQVGVTFVPNTINVDILHVPFSGWNMDTANSFNITIASLSPYITDFTKIVNIDAMVFTNTLSASFPLNVFYTSTIQGGVSTIDAVNITLTRETAGLFDDVAFNAATGHVTIKYLR